MRNVFFVMSAGLLLVWSSAAAAGDVIENTGQAVAFGLPLVAGAISYSKHDERGLSELGLSWLSSVGTAYALSHIVHEKRPDGSDYHSFPSDTAASGYAAAGYLWGRYGWEYGLPAYALAMYAGYSRTEARKHHWYDVLASDVISLGMNYAFVTRYHPSGLNVSAAAQPDGGSIDLTYSW